MSHIALVTTSYPDYVPGAEAAGTFVEDFALELASHVRVTVVAPSRDSSVLRNGSLTVCRFAVPTLPLSLLRPSRPSHWPLIIRTLRAGRREVESLHQRERLDHILALWALPSGWWARGLSGTPYSTWALGSDIWSLGRLPVVRGILRRTIREASRSYADGLALARDVQSISGRSCDFLPSSRRLPAVAGERRATGNGRRLAFLGRWHVNKGIDLLLQALDQLGDEDWQLIDEVRIYGGGPLESDARKATERFSASQRPVVLGGYLDREGAADLIRWADYLLLPSRIESIPVIFSDAMQLGTPIVATPVGDLPELQRRYSFGVLAADVSSEAYAAALSKALRSADNAPAEGLELARNDFDVARAVRRFLADVEISPRDEN
ncbi:MAG: glycosyltransferase [Woeseiaceae bacterium]|nr:glycosyltransferase [Woeseiaceae bacterium]